MKSRGITVKLTTSNDSNNPVALKEMGLEMNTSQDVISCYVESHDGLPFCIDVQADIPFPYPEHSPRTTTTQTFGTSNTPAHLDGSGQVDIPVLNEPGHVEVYPYNFLIEIYIDGNDKSRVRHCLYIDPVYETLNIGQRGRKIVSHSYKCDEHHRLQRYAWSFGKVSGVNALENSMGKLDISESSDNIDQDLLDAFRSTNLEEKSGADEAGQIKVMVRRAIIAKKFRQTTAPAERYEGVKDVAVTDAKNTTITHVTAYKKDESFTPSEVINKIKFRPYVEGEAPFATFTFYYRTHDFLQKFGFLKDDGNTDDSSGNRQDGLTSALGKRKRALSSSDIGGFKRNRKA